MSLYHNLVCISLKILRFLMYYSFNNSHWSGNQGRNIIINILNCIFFILQWLGELNHGHAGMAASSAYASHTNHHNGSSSGYLWDSLSILCCSSLTHKQWPVRMSSSLFIKIIVPVLDLNVYSRYIFDMFSRSFIHQEESLACLFSVMRQLFSRY